MDQERKEIAQYGIASEIGSLVSAIKKKVLSAPGSRWNVADEEIIEELGDIIWYTSMLAGTIENKSIHDVIVTDLRSLPVEINKNQAFLEHLGIDKFDSFKRGAALYFSSDKKTFSLYQNAAFHTSRTAGKDLVHVCLTRLLFYATVIMSGGFTQIEKLL